MQSPSMRHLMYFTTKQCLNDFFGYGLLSIHMRYYVKCRINPDEKQKLPDSINNESAGRVKIFYEGMQSSLREANHL